MRKIIGWYPYRKQALRASEYHRKYKRKTYVRKGAKGIWGGYYLYEKS